MWGSSEIIAVTSVASLRRCPASPESVPHFSGIRTLHESARKRRPPLRSLRHKARLHSRARTRKGHVLPRLLPLLCTAARIDTVTLRGAGVDVEGEPEPDS